MKHFGVKMKSHIKYHLMYLGEFSKAYTFCRRVSLFNYERIDDDLVQVAPESIIEVSNVESSELICKHCLKEFNDNPTDSHSHVHIKSKKEYNRFITQRKEHEEALDKSREKFDFILIAQVDEKVMPEKCNTQEDVMEIMHAIHFDDYETKTRNIADYVSCSWTNLRHQIKVFAIEQKCSPEQIKVFHENEIPIIVKFGIEIDSQEARNANVPERFEYSTI